jgi:hypothetical protein
MYIEPANVFICDTLPGEALIFNNDASLNKNRLSKNILENDSFKYKLNIERPSKTIAEPQGRPCEPLPRGIRCLPQPRYDI